MVEGLYRLFAKDRDLVQGGGTLVNITDFVEWHENSGLVMPRAGNRVASSVWRDRGTLQRKNATCTQGLAEPHQPPFVTVDHYHLCGKARTTRPLGERFSLPGPIS